MLKLIVLDANLYEAILDALGPYEYWCLSLVCKQVSSSAQRRMFKDLRLGSAKPKWSDLSSERQLQLRNIPESPASLKLSRQCVALIAALTSRPDWQMLSNHSAETFKREAYTRTSIAVYSACVKTYSTSTLEQSQRCYLKKDASSTPVLLSIYWLLDRSRRARYPCSKAHT